MNLLKSCKPRKEVLEGELDDAIFAADFGQLIDGTAPKVYADPTTFFRNTEPTPDLKAVCKTVFQALADKKGGGQLLRLSTGFGGGKTHTLMALWHLARKIHDVNLGADLLPAAGRPKEVKVVAIDAQKAGIPIFATHRTSTTKSLHGEIFYQLGGARAVQKLGAVDHHEASPDEKSISDSLGDGPLLILLDELVIYMAGLSAQGQGNFLGFLSKLISSVSKRPQTVLVVTDPAQQAAYANISAQLAEAIQPAAIKLDDILGRKMADFDPVGKQAAKVIARRLFDKIDPAAAKKVAAAYHDLYVRVHEAHNDLIPKIATSGDYARKIEECFPFHPRLIETAKERLGPLPEFQRSRGVLRLFARIVRDVWENKSNLDLITSGDIRWSSERIRADLLQRLRREQFAAAVDADVEGHAKSLDDGKPDGIHRRAASALLLESLPRNEHSGLSPAELTLAILRTDEAGTEPSEAFDRLLGACWHTYPMAGGNGWQFRFEPNVIKQIEQRAALVDRHDAVSRVQTEAQSYFGGALFSLASWPDRAKDVVERKEFQLVLCASVEIAKEVCTNADISDPNAPIPRRYRNAIVAVAPDPGGYNAAIDKARRLIAAEQIEADARHGESYSLVRDQLNRLKPGLYRELRISTWRAFDTVVWKEGIAVRLEERYQVPDEQIMAAPQGQKLLAAFLRDKQMMYGPEDRLDPDIFLKAVLSGSTPIPNQPEAYRITDIHDRFLAAPKLRLISEQGVVRQSILRAIDEGRVILKDSAGSVYDSKGVVEGQQGFRRRREGARPSIDLKQLEDLLTRADSNLAAQWLKVDPISAPGGTKPGGGTEPGGGPSPSPVPPVQTSVTATNWDDIVKHSQTRPLMMLQLDASAPGDAEVLVSLIQPLGADEIALSVSAGGELKSGGNATFNAEGTKINSPIKPLESAKLLFSAMIDGSQYGASVVLRFGTAGRTGITSQLKSVSEKAAPGIHPAGTFGKPVVKA